MPLTNLLRGEIPHGSEPALLAIGWMGLHPRHTAEFPPDSRGLKAQSKQNQKEGLGRRHLAHRHNAATTPYKEYYRDRR